MKVPSSKKEQKRDMSNKKDESSNENDASENDEPEPDEDYNRNNQHKIEKESIENNVLVMKSNTLDEGTLAFIHWLNSNHKNSTFENPIIVKSFQNDKCTVLWDNTILAEVHVETKEGVPVCEYCKTDDCAHVGFTICLEQLHGRGETLDSIEAEAEIESATNKLR